MGQKQGTLHVNAGQLAVKGVKKPEENVKTDKKPKKDKEESLEEALRKVRPEKLVKMCVKWAGEMSEEQVVLMRKEVGRRGVEGAVGVQLLMAILHDRVADLKEFSVALSSHAKSLLGAEHAFCYHSSPEEELLTYTLLEGRYYTIAIPQEVGTPGQAFTSRAPVTGYLHTTYTLACPITCEGTVLGVLQVSNVLEPYGDEDEILLQSLCNVAARGFKQVLERSQMGAECEEVFSEKEDH